MILSLIAAISDNYAIGRNNELLWRLPDDMKFFRKITTGHHVLMGRKTFESFPIQYRPLPDRVNIIITRNHNFKADGCIVLNTIEEGVEYAYKNNEKELLIIGGGEIYHETIDYAHKLYLTVVHKHFDNADTFFPNIGIVDPYHYLSYELAEDYTLPFYKTPSAISNIANSLLNKRVSTAIRRNMEILNVKPNFSLQQLRTKLPELNGNFMEKFLKYQDNKKNFKGCKWLINPVYSKVADVKHQYDFDILELDRLIIPEKRTYNIFEIIQSTYAHMQFEFSDNPAFLRYPM